MTPETLRQLLDARDRLLIANEVHRAAKEKYEQSETAYMNDAANLGAKLDGDTIVIPREDWYDLPVGSRLNFHKLMP